MDEAVKKAAVKSAHVVSLLLLACCLPAAAQALRDPTRPPAAMLQGPGGRAALAAAPASSEPKLQSVLISRQPGGRHVAVIDGETVRLGEMVRGMRVTRMTANEVELVRGRERRVLKLDAPAGPTPPGGGIERLRGD
ncbi:MAG: hypothetical protein AB1584_12105 [Pseudomonadota bacterium]